MTAEDVEATLGVLLAAGHDLDRILGLYTFDQVALMARCITGHHVRMLNLLLSPIAGSMGADYTPHRAPSSPSRRRDPRGYRSADYSTPESKEAGLLNAFAKAGIRVKSAPGAGPPASDG